MPSLNIKVPPPVVASLIAAAMWFSHSLLPHLAMPGAVQWGMVGLLALIGVGFDMGGIALFWQAHTTINPLRPDRTTHLVTHGIYRITRNPMYVGLCFLLAAWSVALSSPLALLGIPLFMAYITRFQIQPEERLLLEKFGEEYAAYMRRVRRWL